MKEIKCPECGGPASKAIYMGIPVKLCMNQHRPDCALCWGFWSFMMAYVPFNGCFMAYSGGWYLEALIVWLRGEAE